LCMEIRLRALNSASTNLDSRWASRTFAMTTVVPSPEAIHPSLWRASQLAHGRGCVTED
jgi:alkyl sulfatase BDS1-like metallo-beta-lactamase superfamily hydrolase